MSCLQTTARAMSVTYKRLSDYDVVARQPVRVTDARSLRDGIFFYFVNYFRRQLCRVNPFRDAEYDRIKSCVENQPLFADNMEIRNYTDQQIPQFQRKCEKDPNYNPSGKLISERSISPWKWVLNIDENRIPREILQAECLCHYCLDPRTGRENYNVDSSPINLEYYVQNNNGELVSEEIPIGCQCNYQSDNY
ncbi:uncharacterized protein LOC143470968 isoform X1 [Clavelina lepadiformis]|uniref:uncharacterized protein LOC143470968 isoform X1 n=1 Tax=Clavelina lepadiformis TaxID=159417 RepID=UPI00404267F0